LRFAESNFPRYAALDGIMPIAARGGIQLGGLGGGRKKRARRARIAAYRGRELFFIIFAVLTS
jgi:hypothetical protein